MVLSVQFGCRSSNVLVSYPQRFDFAQSDRQSTSYSAPLTPHLLHLFLFHRWMMMKTERWLWFVSLYLIYPSRTHHGRCTMNGRDYSLQSCHPWRKCHLNIVNSIVRYKSHPIRFESCSRPSRILRTGMTPLAVERALLGVDRIALHV